MNNPLRADIVRPFIEKHKTILVFSTYFLLLSPFLFYFLRPIISNAFIVVTEPARRVSFDSAKWKDTSLLRSTPDIRLRMIDDLLNRYELKGKSKIEIEAILGKPEDSRMIKEWDMVYWVGSKKGLIGRTAQWLGFRLDEQHVTTYELIERGD